MSQTDDKQAQFAHLNQPLKDPSGVKEANQKFLDDVLSKIEKGTVNLFSPSSLLNQAVYGKLSEQIQGKIDIDAINLLAKLRDIKGLHDFGQTDSYQMENLVENVRLIKERIEAEAGDVFII
jgi:hypothetical protein